MAKGGKVGKNGGATYNFDQAAFANAIVIGCQRAAMKALLMTQREIKEQLSKPGSGRKHPGLRYQSSAPGMPPAVQTGHLRRSWQAGQHKRIAQGRRVGWSVGSNVRYARRLEFGGGRIFARPYLRPSLRQISQSLQAVFSAEIRQQLANIGIKK